MEPGWEAILLRLVDYIKTHCRDAFFLDQAQWRLTGVEEVCSSPERDLKR